MRLRTTLQLASFFPIFMAALFIAYLFTVRLTAGASDAPGHVLPVLGPTVLAIVALLAGWRFYRAGQRLVAQVGTLEQMTERVKRGDLQPANPLASGQGEVAAVAEVVSQMVVELRGYVGLIAAHEQLRREHDAALASAERLRVSGVQVSGALELLRRAEQAIAARLMEPDRFLLSWLPSRALRAVLGARTEAPAQSVGAASLRPDVQEVLRRLVAELADGSARCGAARVPPSKGGCVLGALGDAVLLCRWRWERERPEAPIAVQLDAGAVESFEAQADRVGLVQAFAEVLTNAAEAMPEGGAIAVQAHAEAGGTLTISITDSGLGMSDAVRARCMKPFFSTKEGQLGMGLPLAARLVTRSGGRLGVIGEKGHGATVVMTFPPPPTEAANAPTAPARPSRLNVLLVDDDEPARDALAAMLSKEGHRVTDAPDGAAAVLLLRRKRFDVVMTDLAMPVMTGEELAVAVKDRQPSIPVVLVTSAAEELARRPALPRGVDVILSKPVLRDDLVTALSRAVQGARNPA